MTEFETSSKPVLPETVLIVGSGIAGYSAAQVIRRTAKEVDLTMISEEPDPTYSACVLAEYIAGEIPREKVIIKERAPGEEGSWKRVAGQKAVRIDLDARKLHLENRDSLPFEKLILATGSRGFFPDLPGIHKNGVLCLKTLADADRVLQAAGEEAVVVGAGPVGLEVAVALRRRGRGVTVVELLDRLLPRLFSPVHAQMIQRLLEREGVRVLVGESVREIAGGEYAEGVVTDKRRLPCRLVLMGIGMRPEVSLAERTGIRIGTTGGIAVDEAMRTNHKDVFACGDCAETVDRLTGKPGLNMLWGNAKTQGAVAGMNCIGLKKRYPGDLNITTMKIHDVVATSVGEVALADASFHEIVKHQGERCSVRLVVQEGLIRGIQAVGPHVDISIFLNMLLSGERLHSLRDSKDKRLLLGQKPWLIRLPAFLRE